MKQIIFEQLQPKTVIMADKITNKDCVGVQETGSKTKYIFLSLKSHDNGKYVAFRYIHNADIIPHLVTDEDGDVQHFDSPLELPHDQFNFFVFDTQKDMFEWLVKDKQPVIVTKKRWSVDDDAKLEFLYKADKSMYDLAEIFSRSQIAISCRLKKLGLK